MLTDYVILVLTKTKQKKGGKDMINRKYKLKSARASLGYTQDDTATRLGMSKHAYCLKENGQRQFSEKEMIKLAKVLNISLDYVFLEN